MATVKAWRLCTLLYIAVIFLENFEDIEAKLIITGESEYGHVGEDFIFICVPPTIPYQIYWHRNRFPVASQKLNLNGCSVLVHSSSNYIYSCRRNSFMLRIPGENMTEDENDSSWSCSGDDWSKSNIFHLKVIVRVSEVFMFKNIQTDKTNDADIVTLSCESNPCRPFAKVKWYNGDEEITNNMTIQTEKINTLYITTSSVTINTTYERTNNIYCKASNLPSEKSVESNIYIHSSRDSKIIYMYSVNNKSRLIVDETKDIIFTCDRNNSDNRFSTFIENSRHNFHPERSLMHPVVQLQYPKCTDSSNYTCSEEYSENSVEVVVQCKPVLISTIPSAFNTIVGELIEIELDTIAFPTPTVTCGLKRTNQCQQSYLQDCRFNVTVISHTLIHHTFTFWKEKIEHTDFGEYKIVIENGIGKGNLVFFILLKEQKSRKIKAPLLSVSVGTLSGILLFIFVFIFVARRLKTRKLAERINHDRQIHQEMTEWHKSGSDLSGIDMEMFVCISDNMAEYENNGRIKELEADSVYHDLELDDVERTRIEWPYEDIKADNGDQSRSSGFINIEAEDS